MFYSILTTVTILVLSTNVVGSTFTVPSSNTRTIQSAIDLAVDGDEIIVNSGVYNESLDTLGKSIWLHAATNAEVIVEALPDARHLTINTGESSNTIIEGIVFDGLTTSGGLEISGSSPTIRDCEIRHCDWNNGGGARISGGSPTIIGCLFVENHGTSSGTYGGGAAMNIRGGASVRIESSIIVTDETQNNQSNGIMVEGGSNLQLTDCSFSGTALVGGTFAAFLYNAYSSVTITRCTFDGGFGASQLFGWSGFVLDNCTFRGHMGPGPSIKLNSGTMNITNCVFENNTSGCIDDHYSTNISIGDTLFCGSANYYIDAPWNDLGGNVFPPEYITPVLGACCINGEAIAIFDNDCERILGEFMGEGTVPNEVICSAICSEDVDGDGMVDVADLLSVLGAWGARP